MAASGFNWTGWLGHHDVSAAGLAGYRRLGAQVLDLQNEIPAKTGRAQAYFYAARCLQLLADQLVEDAFADPTRPGHLPQVTVSQAESLYRQTPDLITAARQEVLAPGGPRDVDLPVLLHGRVEPRGHRLPISHLQGMLRGAAAVVELAEGIVRPAGPEAAHAKALFAEAVTNRDSAQYLVGGLDGGSLPPASAEQAGDYLWAAVAYAMGALQECAVPGILGDLDIDTVLEGRGQRAQAPRPAATGLEAELRALQDREMREAEQQRWRDFGERERGEHHHHHHHHHEHEEWERW